MEAFVLADRTFFDAPGNWDLDATRYPAPALPADWRRGEDDAWTFLRPPGHQLPDQGWKIHVSAVAEDAEKTIHDVVTYCVEHRIACKYLRSRNTLAAFSRKYAPRASAGKLLTVYPVGEPQLETTLRELDELVGGRPGPYLLTDLKYGDGPVHARYGGFRTQYLEEPDGTLVTALRRPDGTLVADRRAPVFTLPEGVAVPECLRPAYDARTRVDAFPYRVTGAMHFSNGGGVYTAEPDGAPDTPGTGHPTVVLKEGRPYTGTDGAGRDAVQRVEHEYAVLRRLHGIPGIVQALGIFSVRDHRFLVLEQLTGDSLQTWLVKSHPLIHPDPDPAAVTAYARRVLALTDRIEALVGQVHARGVRIGDLHPGNLIIDADDQPYLLDFEAADDIEPATRTRLGAPGFCRRDALGAQVDLYSLAATTLWLLLPLNGLFELAPGKVAQLLDAAQERFGLPDDTVAALAARLLVEPETGPAHQPERSEGPPHWQGPSPDLDGLRASLGHGIRRSAQPGRTDRLYPGGYQQFLEGGTGFAHGAAGVLWALDTVLSERHEAGVDWLRRAAADATADRVGFYDGLHGMAYTLDHFGEREAALSLLERAADTVARRNCPGLYRGLSGIGLNLLHFSARTEDAGFRATAVDLADRVTGTLARALREPVKHERRSGSRSAAGLLHGWSGAALFLLRLYETTGDTALLDEAVRAVHRDLDRCGIGPQGVLAVDEGFRLLPYLEDGSAGIALVAKQLLRHRDDDRIRAAVPGLIRSCYPEFVLESSLFNGRAGLMATLDLVATDDPTATDEPDGARPYLDRHLDRLRWHALERDGDAVFPGSGLLRISMDIATGGAGVLLALGALRRPEGERRRTPLLPFLTDSRTESVLSRTRP